MTLPEVFGQDDVEGLVVLVDDEPPDTLHDRVREAAYLCPAAAIQFFAH